MNYAVNDYVVHATYGVGRIVGLVTRKFTETDARRYYEIEIDRSTVWVPVEAGDTTGELRILTPRAELARYRMLLQSQPTPMTKDHRQRRLDVTNRMKIGSLQDLCEIVRDLTARSWDKALNEMDAAGLRKAREALCREWAAADGVSTADASQEIEALLQRCRQAYRA